MGDRNFIGIQQPDVEGDVWLYFYTHSCGPDVQRVVGKAIARAGERRLDPAYFARILFCDLVEPDPRGTRGYGIWVDDAGNEPECDMGNTPVYIWWDDKNEDAMVIQNGSVGLGPSHERKRYTADEFLAYVRDRYKTTEPVRTDLTDAEKKALSRQATASFHGETYEAGKDYTRLRNLADRVFDVMSDGQWHTIDGVQKLTGGSHGGTAARIRDLRKEKFGAHIVERRRVAGHNGLHEYRLIRNFKSNAQHETFTPTRLIDLDWSNVGE
jgi:hypothetical protein